MSEDSNLHKLEERIARLERKVSMLEEQLTGAGHSGEVPEVNAGQPDEEPEIAFEESPPESRKEQWITDHESFGQNWLNWIGIALLLIGVSFLFKYSIDQGWLIPPVRSVFGLSVGLILLVLGYQTDENRETFKSLLLGGGIAVFYITGFATFQLYSFATYAAVWAFMIVVTLLSLSLSLQQNRAVLAVLGTLGGLGTPFMLYRGEGSLTMLVLYTCIVLAGSGIIYLFKGWKSLLWSTVAGGSLVYLVGWFNNIVDPANPVYGDRWALQAGVLFAAVVVWVVPVVREILTCRNPKKWPDPSFVNSDGEVDKHTIFVADSNVQLLSVIIPIGTLFYSFGIWSFSEELWGGVALVCALLVGYSYFPLRNEGLNRLSLVHGFTALILITVSLFLLLEGEILLISLAMEGLILRIISARTGDENISTLSHLVFGIVGFWLMERFLSETVTGTPMINLNGITDLFILGIGGMAVPYYLRNNNSKMVYRLFAHVALLGWFLKELVVLEDGQAWATVAWGIYAISILFIGFWKNHVRARLIGMATIFIVVGKLFLVDLNQIQTLLRILLFIGFGTLFLGVGYYLQKRWGDMFGNERAKAEVDEKSEIESRDRES